MTACYLIREPQAADVQTSSDRSFIGGHPVIPRDTPIPDCALCNQAQTFFFQIAMPDDSVWPQRTVAVFACTSCAQEDYLIPEMLPGSLPDIDIPVSFLLSYQRNFRFLVFPSANGVLRQEHPARVAFRRLKLEASSDPLVDGMKVGGYPNWILEDESPISYADKTPMRFLFQLPLGYSFATVDGAPPQAQIDWGLPVSPRRHYELFIGNAAYFFGTQPPADPLIYVITQVD